MNQVAVLTAPGMAGIAVVRLSGPGVQDFLTRRFSKPVPMDRCIHGLLKKDERVIDDCVVVCHGDIVDLSLHGGTWVVQSALDLALSDGFELSDVRSVDGKNELWNLVLRSLPMARTEQAVRMLLAQPKAWESAGDLRKIRDDYSGKWMLATPRVAMVGPANVGKSTLANQLFGQARSITADLPGTTRDWVGEIANINGLAVMLVDTPGIRVTGDKIEAAAIAGSQQQIHEADLIILVLDQSADCERGMIETFPDAVRVANKADGIVKWNAGEFDAIQTVATDGRGIDQLRTEIRRRFGLEPLDLLRARWWTDEQREALKG